MVESLKKTLMVILSAGFIFSNAYASQDNRDARPAGNTIKASDLNQSHYAEYVDWLGKWGRPPVHYIVEKCKEHQLVIIGEQHNILEYCNLFRQALPEVYHHSGVRVVALEVCNIEDNEKINLLIEGQRYDEQLAYDIARSHNWGLWGYKEYWDIFRTVWELNRSLPPEAEHLKIVGIDKRTDYQLDQLWRAGRLSDPALIKKAENQPDIYKRDEWMRDAIAGQILDKSLKGIVLVGFHHSFTHYAQPVVNEENKLAREWERMAHLLHQKYQDKIFQIGLHGPHPSPAMITDSYKGNGPVMTELLENIFATAGNEPMGFDVVGSPFAGIRDDESYYFHWQPKRTFSELCRGYIFIKPMADLHPCSWMENYVTEEMFNKSRSFYEYSYGRKFTNSKEVNDFFKSGKGSL
jgi:hypothetical protein